MTVSNCKTRWSQQRVGTKQGMLKVVLGNEAYQSVGLPVRHNVANLASSACASLLPYLFFKGKTYIMLLCCSISHPRHLLG